MVKTMDAPSIDEIFKVANLAMKYCMGQLLDGQVQHGQLARHA